MLDSTFFIIFIFFFPGSNEPSNSYLFAEYRVHSTRNGTWAWGNAKRNLKRFLLVEIRIGRYLFQNASVNHNRAFIIRIDLLHQTDNLPRNLVFLFL